MSLLISCDNNKQASQEANKINTPSSSNPKIVYVNIDTLLTKYNLYIDKKSELEAESKVGENHLPENSKLSEEEPGNFNRKLLKFSKRQILLPL